MSDPSEKQRLGLVWGAAALHATIFFALGVDRYLTHHSLVDFGVFTQVTASAFSTFSSTWEGVTHWGVHFSPILLLCAPFVIATHSGLALTAIAAVAIALAIPAVYLIARRRASANLALLVAAVAFLYPPMAALDFTDFHETVFEPAAALWLLWAIDGRRWPAAYAFAAILLAVKEDQAIILGVIGIAAIVLFGRRNERAGVRFGAVTLAASLAVFVGYFIAVRHIPGALAPHETARFYGWSWRQVTTWGVHTLPDRAGYLLLALLPLAFVPLRSPIALLAVPGLAECVLSREIGPFTPGSHYAGAWIPYLLAAFATTAPRLRAGWAAASVVLCVLNFAVADPLHPGYFLGRPGTRDSRLNATLSRLPADASVGTQEEAFTHLGFDPNAQIGLENEPEYALLDDEYPSSVALAWTENELRPLLVKGCYRLIERDGGIRLYQRVKACATGSYPGGDHA